MQPPPKAIPESRAALQSNILVWTVGLMLFACCVPCLVLMLHPYNTGRYCLESFGISLTFGILVWALKAATPMAAVCGGMICLLVTIGTMNARRGYQYTALLPLALLFALTFVATRIGKRRRPDLTSQREARRGRTASQVIANLGIAALVVPGGLFNWYDWTSKGHGIVPVSVHIVHALVLAALAEATADTLSSELGQAYGGTPYLLTTFRPAPTGTDGAISVIGTAAGVLGAALVTAAGAWAMHLTLRQSLYAFAGGVAGLFFDSVLGATVERRGWLNNDLVNFSSTAFAAMITLLLCAVEF